MYISSQNCFPVFVSSMKHEIRKSYHQSDPVTGKKCTKKCDAHAKLLFCLSKKRTYCFFADLLVVALVVA